MAEAGSPPPLSSSAQRYFKPAATHWSPDD
jgi:hypothetical protein